MSCSPSLVVLVCASLQAFEGAEPAGWMQFRGPNAQGVVADEEPLPARLDLEHGLLWSAPVGPGHSSPCVVRDLVVVTAATEHELSTVALDRATGERRWSRSLPAPAVERIHEVNSLASPTPASDGERIFAYFGCLGLVAYDREGRELWRRSFGEPANTFGTAASPIVAGGKLVLNRDTDRESFLVALDPASGETLWRRERSEPKSGWSTPVVREHGGARELVVYGPGWLAAYDLSDGSPRWSLPGLTDEPCITPVVAGDLVVLASYNMNGNPEVIGIPEFATLVASYDEDGDGALDRGEVEPNQSILSREGDDGDGDHPLRIFFRFLDVDRDGEIRADEWPKIVAWLNAYQHANAILAVRPGEDGDVPAVVWSHARGVPECPSPLVYRDRVFAVRNGGVLTCLELASGAPVFQRRLEAGGPYYASAVAGDGRLLLASARGELTWMSADGDCPVLSRLDLDERIMATPALSRGVVYVRTATRLLAFGSS